MNIIIVKLVLLIFISQLNHSVIAHHIISDNENCGRLGPSVRHYIYGGKSAQIEQWPWQLHMKITDNEHSIMENDHANCGATLIEDNWIITAAHCFSGHRIPKLYLLNGHNFTVYDNYKLIKYDRIVIHPDYYEYSGQHEYSTNDIALVKLSDENKFDRSIPKPCLPKQDSIIPINSICYITGFGAMNKNDNQVIKRIREGRVAIKNDKICTRTLSLTFYDRRTMMCAGRAKGSKANSCQGDSGGPLVCEGSFGDSRDEQWYLFGITSFGAFDCSSYTSSVYTKVSTYVDWINKTIQYS